MFFAKFSLFFIIPSIYCENAGEDVQGLSRKITLMKEKFDLELSSVQANIQVLNGKVDKLEKLTSEQADEISDLKSQNQYLQEITKIVTVVESCLELSNHGIQESRKYDVDFDGKNNGEDPVNVFCQLPEGLTRIGEPVEATLENCNQPGCFEFDIDYNVSMTQIAALIQKSSTCTQSIEFNCFSAPLKFNGQNLLSWVDRNGIEHKVTLDSNNCDSKRPVWQTDSGSINEKELLPITAIKYGPLLYAEEMGKVKVGPLECNPLESHEIIDINELSDQVEKLEDGLNASIIEHATEISHLTDKLDATNTKIEQQNEVVLKVKKQCDCPTQDTNYRLISRRCYYYDSSMMTYEKAKQLCATKFLGGKLFEPENLAINNLVWNSFKDINIGSSWIGINEKNSENNFHYDKSGIKVPFNPRWYPKSGNRYANTCVVIFTGGQWYDYPCTNEYNRKVLCEQ